MSHAYHGDLKGVVLREGCSECEVRADRDLYGLTSLDPQSLAKLRNIYEGGPLADEASALDRKAANTLSIVLVVAQRAGLR